MKAYFEGWYYKLIDANEREMVAIIPGVSFDTKGQDSNAFIQLLDTSGSSGTYFKFDIDEFCGSSKCFEVKVGQSYFSSSRISVNATNGTNAVNGTLSFSNITPWPTTLFSPGAMGWYAFVPFMECYHAVLSFDHTIEGALDINGRHIDFTGGRGYTEKDWGKSFPRYHVWLQTNHFDKPGTSLMVSIANIPWLGSYFDGFIAGFLYNNQIYRLTTYTGARLTLFQMDEEHLNIHISSNNYRLEIGVSEQKGITLRAPILGDMKGRLQESQTADTHARLYHLNKQQEELIFEGIGRNTGLEIAGNRDELRAIHVRSRS